MSSKFFISLFFLILGSITIAQHDENGKKLIILHTNDMHSRLDGYAPTGDYSPMVVNDDKTIGGFSRIASIIRAEKELYPENTLVLDGGDFLMGTIYHYMEEYNGFQLPLMSEMGYDFVAIGNHEFDFGPAKLAKIIDKSLEGGEIPGLLLTNAVLDANSVEDDGLEKLYSNNTIKRTSIIERDGIKIGLFSLMGIDADDVAPSAMPVKFSKQKKSARRAVKLLLKESCDIIICLSHSGVEKNKKGEWAGEDVKLAKRVRGIDIIVSGHTHSTLNQPVVIKDIPIIQTGSFGRNVGRLELNVKNGKIEVENYSLIPVDDKILGDEAIQSQIDGQKLKITESLFKPLGYNPTEPLIESEFDLVCDEYGGDLENSNLGPLVVDAIHSYINNYSRPGTDVSMVATGVIRDRLVAGELAIQDIFRVMSLGSGKDNIPGYPLATVYLSGLELKRVVEILLVASKSTPSNFCYYAGLQVNYNPEKGLLKKVSSMAIVDAEGNMSAINTDKESEQLYSVSANAYMLEFIGIIKKTTFGLVNVSPRHADGSAMEEMSASIIDFDDVVDGIQEGKEWIALVEYLRKMADLDGNGIGDLDQFYLTPPLRIIPQAGLD